MWVTIGEAHHAASGCETSPDYGPNRRWTLVVAIIIVAVIMLGTWWVKRGGWVRPALTLLHRQLVEDAVVCPGGFLGGSKMHRDNRSKRALASAVALFALLYSTGFVDAKAVTIQQKQTPSQLKKSCDAAGGNYGVTTNGTAWCGNADKGTLVTCDVKTHACSGYVPD
jgi:hypothetical protein